MMTTDIKPYPAYKDSGVEWLGEVPAHWELPRLGALLQERGEVNSNGHVGKVLSVLRDRGVIPYSEKGNIGNKMSEDITRYKVVRPNDIVVNCMNVIIGSVGLSRYTGCLSPVYYVLTRRSEDDDSQYLNAYFQTKPFQESLVRIGNGILAHRMRIPMELLKCEIFPRPPTGEQTAIVSFLDHADRRIWRYIRAKQKLIALLEEQKQAIIHQAVTGQIDVRTGEPYSSYKDSGVEWLGKVPEHWEVRRIGGFSKIGNGSTPARSNQAYWNGGSYPWLNSSSVNQGTVMKAEQFVTETALQECHLPQVPADSVLVGITGQGKTRGMAAVLAIEATINQHVAYITPNNSRVGASPGYLHMCLTAAYTELRAISSASGSTKGALTCEDIKSFRVVLPPVDEQEAVLLAIRRKLANVEGCADLERRQINLVKEYRTRLIADVVTGKLDVREATPAQPSVDPLKVAEGPRKAPNEGDLSENEAKNMSE